MESLKYAFTSNSGQRHQAKEKRKKKGTTTSHFLIMGQILLFTQASTLSMKEALRDNIERDLFLLPPSSKIRNMLLASLQ